jgi:hypothetical protein
MPFGNVKLVTKLDEAMQRPEQSLCD